MAGADRDSRRRLEVRRRTTSPRSQAARSLGRARAHRQLSRKCSAPPSWSRARISSPRSSPSSIPIGSQRLLAEQDRVCALLARERALAARDRTARARHHRRRRDRALPRREGPPRAARLRRPDRQDAASCSRARRAAWVLYKLDLGIDHVLIDEAQDTSPKQWEIVQHLVAEFTPGGARAERQAHDVRGRRREAVDLLVPGRGAARLRRDAAATSRGQFDDGRAGLALPCASSTRSAPAQNVLGAVDQVFARARSLRRRHRRSRPATAAHRAARRRARAGRAVAADRAGRAARDRRLGRAVRHRERDKPARACWRARIAAHVEALDGARAARPATCWCWCASAGRCSRRSSAR